MDSVSLTYNDLIKKLKKDVVGFKVLKLAVLADFASQHYVQALKGALVARQFSASVWEADYNSIDSTIISEQSELYQEQFDYIIVVPSVYKIHKEFIHKVERKSFADATLTRIKGLVSLLTQRTRSTIILTNYQELNDGVFGNYANKTEQSFLFQLRKINYELMLFASQQPGVFIADAQSLHAEKGLRASFDPKMYFHADLIYSLDFVAALTQQTAKIIAAVEGRFKKCVIVDLDNTLWGGIIGDDGIDNIQIGDLGIGKAYTALQEWLLELKNRGIILAVCSKNTESVAKEVFEKHPAMTLRLKDISVFVANWETKVDNIIFIQSVLNIGFDSMVFLDDSPFERGIVKQNVPDLEVPDLPEDPAEYLPYLRSLNLFEVAGISNEDSQRTKQYQEEASRMELQKLFTNENEFLESLKMTADVQAVNDFLIPRVAQLTQRSNQFNLRTARYTEDDVRRIMNNPDFLTITLSLADIYGDYGLISVVFLEKKSNDSLFIDTWIMSCRVLKRGVESFVLNEIVAVAQKTGFRFIDSEYLPTAKNKMVQNHYPTLGFETYPVPGKYRMDTKTYKPINTFIHKLRDYVEY